MVQHLTACNRYGFTGAPPFVFKGGIRTCSPGRVVERQKAVVITALLAPNKVTLGNFPSGVFCFARTHSLMRGVRRVRSGHSCGVILSGAKNLSSIIQEECVA